MNFDFSEEQKELQNQAAKFLAGKCPPSEVHRLLNSDDTHSAALWQDLVEQGWTATALPETCGGFGMGYLELCILAQELGRVCAPVPFASSVYLAGEAIRAAGSKEQRKTYLCQMSEGSLIGTLARTEPSPKTHEGGDCQVKASRLFGVKTAVPDGEVANLAVVTASTGAAQHSLFLVNLEDENVRKTSLDSLDNSRNLSELEFDGAAAEPLGKAGSADEYLEKTLQRAAVLFAFEQLGGAEKALEMAISYAVERKAFGRAIGSFQAIKHRLAELYVEVEIARSNCYHGAYALSTDAADLPVAGAAAYVSASQAFTACARENIQVHGGAGFTWSGNCQLYYRRALWLSQILGGQRIWKQRLVSRLLDSRRQAPIALEAAHGL